MIGNSERFSLTFFYGENYESSLLSSVRRTISPLWFCLSP